MTRINLLPPDERKRASREQGMAFALIGLIALVVALGAVYFLASRQVATREDTVADQQSQIDQLNQQVAALKPYALLQSQRTSMTDTAKQILDARIAWSSVLEEVGLLIPDNMCLTELEAAVPPTMQAGGALGAGGAAAAATAGTDTPNVTFRGKAPGHSDVAEFMTRLGLMPQLSAIRLISAEKEEGVVNFEIGAKLRPFVEAPPMSTTVGVQSSPGGEQ